MALAVPAAVTMLEVTGIKLGKLIERKFNS